MRALLCELYDSDTGRARSFRRGLLAFDLLTLAYVLATTFLPPAPWIAAVDVVIGLLIALDVAARLVASPKPMRELLRLTTLTDLAALATFLAPLLGVDAGLLRMLRTLRLLRVMGVGPRTAPISEGTQARLRDQGEAAMAVVNLAVFIFVMTEIVYETQAGLSPDIASRADALYFTVTALTTTGFGDITLPGTTGRMLAVGIMIVGVTLFLRLAQVLFRPAKVTFQCPACGLRRHDPDAVHCKACGNLLDIPDEGSD